MSLARVPPALGLAFRATAWMARLRGPEFTLGLLTSESVSDETAETVHWDLLSGLDGRPTGAVRESRLFACDWSLPTPDLDTVHVYHGVEDENVPIGPVRAAYTNLPDVSRSEVETDHLGALVATTEAVVGLVSD